MPFLALATSAWSSRILSFFSVSSASIGFRFALTWTATWEATDASEAISIDEIRFHPERGAQAHDQSLQQFLSLKPFVATMRVALLANAERMTEAAQNCLLKTLEEPPPNTVLILTTAYPDHLLPTCLSRCQVIGLSLVGRPALAGFIAGRHDNAEEAEVLAGLAHGRPGWAVRAISDPDWVARLG